MVEVFDQVERVLGWAAYVLVPAGLVLYAVSRARGASRPYASTRRWPISAYDVIRDRSASTSATTARASGSLLVLAGLLSFVGSFFAYAVVLTLTDGW